MPHLVRPTPDCTLIWGGRLWELASAGRRSEPEFHLIGLEYETFDTWAHKSLTPWYTTENKVKKWRDIQKVNYSVEKDHCEERVKKYNEVTLAAKLLKYGLGHEESF